MPVLRQAPDNTLAETLGNLGSSLSNAFNPLNQLRANNMQSEIQQRQWELNQKQTLDTANRNAADVFVRTFDGILPPGVVASEGARIRAGQGNIEGAVNAAQALKTYQGNQAAAALIDADPEMAGWDAADRENVRARVAKGESLSVAKKDHAQQKLEEGRTTSVLGASSAAEAEARNNPATSGATAALTGAEVYSDPAKAAQLLAGGRVAGTTGALTPAQTDKAQADRESAGYPRLPLGTAVTVEGQAAADADAAKRAAETKRQEGVAEVLTKGIPPTGNIFTGGPLPGQAGNTIGAPYDPGAAPGSGPYPPSPLGGAPSTAPLPKPADVTVSSPDAPMSLPVPVTRAVPGVGTIVGETAPEATERQALDTDTRGQVKEAISGGDAGIQMIALLNRLKVLAQLAQTGGSSQIPVWVDGWLRDHHLVATDRQGILAEMQSLFQAQIPQLRKDMGVKFEAGPELSAQGKMIGDASLPYEVLMGIFGRQAAIAQIAIDRRELALRASMPNHPNPLSRADWLNQDAQVMNNLSTKMKESIEQSGGYTPRTQAPPPVPQSSISNAIRAMLEHLGLNGGGPPSQPPLTPQTPSSADEVWDVQNGKPVRVR